MTPEELIGAMHGEGAGTPTGKDSDGEEESGGREEQTRRGAAASRRVNFRLPPNPSHPTLEAGLKKIALAQSEDADIALDLDIQGKEHPTDYTRWREYLTTLQEPMVLVGLIKNNSPVIQLFHSIGFFAAPPRNRDIHSGKYIAAVGDRSGDAEPSFVTMTEDDLKWKSNYLPASCAEDSPIGEFFANAENQWDFCPKENITELSEDKHGFPLLPMVPGEVGYKIARRQARGEAVTVWDLLFMLVEYVQGRSDDVKAVVQPAINFASFATVEGTRGNSQGALTLPAVLNPSPALRKFMSQRLETTLGHREKQQPVIAQPSMFAQRTVQQVAEGAIRALQPQAPPQVSLADIGEHYQKGVNDMMRIMQENQSDSVYGKRFTEVQKASICGWSGVTTWKDVPDIWKQIERSKLDSDLRRVLTEAFKRFEEDINLDFHRIYWVDKLMESLRKVELAAMDHCSFLTSEEGLSILLLMPFSPEEKSLMELEKRRKQLSKGNWSYADAKRAEKLPRIPPGRYSEVIQLLTTYGLVLQVLFGSHKSNRHLAGVNAVRAQLKMMGNVQHKLEPLYFINVIWAVMQDACAHFSECMPPEEIAAGAATPSTLRWPRSGLPEVVASMRGKQSLNFFDLPDEWREVVTNSAYQRSMATTGGWDGGGFDTKEAWKPALDEKSGKQPGKRGEQKSKWDPLNHNIDPMIAKFVQPHRNGNGNLSLSNIFTQGGVTKKQAAQWLGTEEGICPSFSTGYCGNARCPWQHLPAKALPDEYPKYLCNLLDKCLHGKKRKRADGGDEGKSARDK